MEFCPFTRDVLATMHNMLTDSAGYNVSLADELEYFNSEAATGWLLVIHNDKKSGFIRDFKQTSEWSMAEFYVSPGILNREVVADSLLKKFKQTASFPKGHRLRIDIQSSDELLSQVLKKNGFSERVQILRHFEWGGASLKGIHATESVSVADAEEVAEVLSHLHPVSVMEAQKWIESQTIRVVREDGIVSAAAQIYESEDSIEINRFATHEHHLRKGFAKKLIQAIFFETISRRKKCVYLKVEDTRLPAISFYNAMGFVEKKSKCQEWHSHWY